MGSRFIIHLPSQYCLLDFCDVNYEQHSFGTKPEKVLQWQRCSIEVAGNWCTASAMLGLCVVEKREAICSSARGPLSSFSEHSNFPFILPRLLSEDKWQAVNFHWSHGLSVTHTTHGWIGLFGLLKRMFLRQTEYEPIPYFWCVSRTYDVHPAEEEKGVFGFLAENWLRGCLGWQEKGGEWVGCIFGFQLHSEVFPCVHVYKYSSFSVFCINSWNTFIYLHLQFQKIDHSWVVSCIKVLADRLTLLGSTLKWLLFIE